MEDGEILDLGGLAQSRKVEDVENAVLRSRLSDVVVGPLPLAAFLLVLLDLSGISALEFTTLPLTLVEHAPSTVSLEVFLRLAGEFAVRSVTLEEDPRCGRHCLIVWSRGRLAFLANLALPLACLACARRRQNQMLGGQLQPLWPPESTTTEFRAAEQQDHPHC